MKKQPLKNKECEKGKMHHLHLQALMYFPIILCQLIGSQGVASEFGHISGDIWLHTESLTPDVSENEAYVNTHLGLKYETPDLYGLSVAGAFRNGTKIWEKNDDDAKNATGNLLTESYLQYEGEDILFRIGRQEIQHKWIEDFHEAATLSYSAWSLLEISTGYTRRIAVADEGEFSDFDDIGQHGTYFGDLLFKIDDEIWDVNPYILHTPDLYTGYGVQLTFSLEDQLGFKIHYASSDLKETSNDNNSIFHTFLKWKIIGIDVGAGFIQTGKDGIGLFDLLGDNINPLEEGNLVYEADATTYYTSLEYTYKSLGLQLLVGNTNAENLEESEVDFFLQYDLEAIRQGVSLECIYSLINSKDDEEDYSLFTLNFKYEFGDE